MALTLIKNGILVDGTSDEPNGPIHVLVEGDRIREVSSTPIRNSKARVIDLVGRTLMPGLIDCHVHVVATTPDFRANAKLPNSIVSARSVKILNAMLMRGFTSVRDLGGADIGLVMAIEEGTIAGPRLTICGKALSQSGGNCDYRGRFHNRSVNYYPDRLGALGRVCDGVSEVRRSVREEIKGGASFIKLMANGGVSARNNPIDHFGFSREEIATAVEEAQSAETYCAAHLYTNEAIARCIELGVRCVEHGNFIQPETAALMKKKGAVSVPTLVTYEALSQNVAKLDLSTAVVAKIDHLREAGLTSLQTLSAAGIDMGYGTDLSGYMHSCQSEEFIIRNRVLPAKSVIASATHIAARVIRMEGKIGSITPGAYADMIVVEGNPLNELSLLTNQGKHMPLIMRSGVVFKNTLN